MNSNTKQYVGRVDARAWFSFIHGSWMNSAISWVDQRQVGALRRRSVAQFPTFSLKGLVARPNRAQLPEELLF